jgi:saccharopine dehydrogenase (NAD+, L-lysine-forming)
MKIGLIRERKQPADSRVALTPTQAKELMEKYPEMEVWVEPSEDRIFTDEMYRAEGVRVSEAMEECDVLLGIKEVPKENLIPRKTYLFFSHTIKKQPYNQALFREMVRKKIRMIDYECLTWPKGGRILGFGVWAGIVGAYNGLLTWGKKFGLFDLRPAHQCSSYAELKEELKKVALPPIKIAYTGGGRVAAGIREVLEHVQWKELTPEAFLKERPDEPVFTQLDNPDLYQRKNGEKWDTNHFFNHHTEYVSTFDRFISETDLLINGMYWEDDLPALFTKEDTKRPDFSIKVIADITCDVEGSVPITLEATPIHNPTLGWDPVKQSRTEPFGDKSIDVMAVTNLPTEMPADASATFGQDLLQHVLPLFLEDAEGILSQATLTVDGKLAERYAYLQDYLEG